MASQQPTRTWFRLPSVARPAPTPAPPPAVAPEAPPPQPRPPLIRPTFRPITLPQPQPEPAATPPTATLPQPVSAPPSPQTARAPPPSPPPPANTRAAAVPVSPPKPSPERQSIVPPNPSPIRTRDTSAARVATTPPPQPPPLQQLLEPSPRTIKPMLVRTPPPQPRTTNHAPPPPPSPLVLPPTQAIPDPRIPPEAEQKTILVQHEKNHHPHHPHRVKNKEGTPPPAMRVITIAGENKGAFMELVRPQQRTINIGEERGGDGKAARRAFANSNVQGVNNSIVYNSSCNHHDPGVHLSFSRKKLDGGPPPPALPGIRQRSKEGPAGDYSSGHLS